MPVTDAFLSDTYLNESVGYTQLACEDVVDETPIECVDDITIKECSLDSFMLERLTGQLVQHGDKEFVDVAEQSVADFTVSVEVGDECDLTETQIGDTVARVINESVTLGSDADEINIDSEFGVM